APETAEGRLRRHAALHRSAPGRALQPALHGGDLRPQQAADPPLHPRRGANGRLQTRDLLARRVALARDAPCPGDKARGGHSVARQQDEYGQDLESVPPARGVGEHLVSQGEEYGQRLLYGDQRRPEFQDRLLLPTLRREARL